MQTTRSASGQSTKGPPAAFCAASRGVSPEAYVDWIEEIARESHAAGLSPLEAAQKHAGGPYADWPEAERVVCNLHRAYTEVDPAYEPPVPLRIPALWPEMVALHGGPIACHA